MTVDAGASVKNQATDTFAAAAASASDHDDLAARRRDARESKNVRAVRHDKEDSAPGPFVDDRPRAGGQGFSLIAQHDHIAKCRLGFDRSQLQQRCRVHAAAPRRAEDSFDRNPFRAEPRADPCGVRASLGAEIALSGAVIEPEARRVAGATRRIGMAHQGDMPACVQRGPGRGLAGAGDVRRGAEAEEDCEESETDAAHGGGPRQKYAIRMLTSAAAISSSLAWNAGLRTTCAASALNNRNPMPIASRKPKRDMGSSNCAIGGIGIARPNPSTRKSSARIDPTSTTKPRMCRISTAG